MNGQQLLRSTWNWPWDAEEAPDGAVWVRQGSLWRSWQAVVMLAGSLLLAYTMFQGYSQRYSGHGSGWAGLIACLPPLLALGASLWLFFYREQWRAQPGILEVEQEFLGFCSVRRFTGAAFIIRLGAAYRGRNWFLQVQSPEGRKTLAFQAARNPGSWAGTKIERLAQIVADATRFPIRDAQGKVQYWRADPMPGQAGGSPIQIRHLNTGQVMEQVPGGTLAGARLAKAMLEGADLQAADLRGADLTGADLRGASLKGAQLTNASLRGTLLTATDLTGADLTGADLTGTTLLGASYDAATRWPQGFDPRQHKAVLAE